MLIDRRHEGEDPSIVDSIMLEEVKNVPLLADKERAEYLLRYIADQESSSPGLAVRIGYPIVPGALAHSESWTDSQVKTLVFYMEGAQWVKVVRILDGMTCSLTSDGHVHLDAMREEPKGRQVFVAMWFDSGMTDAYEHGIAPGHSGRWLHPGTNRRKEERKPNRRRHHQRNQEVAVCRGGHDPRRTWECAGVSITKPVSHLATDWR